jgi:GntR family phosphonate transport system transcriptional regulator
VDLQRGSGTALWRQIEETLAGELVAGVWLPGTQMPTEADLANRFAVNRHTLRRAVAALEERGLVRVEQGRGTFVQEHVIDYTVGKRTRFSEIISRQRRDPGGKLLRALTVPAPPAAARELGLRTGQPTILIERLGSVDGHPINVASHWFPARRFSRLIEAFEEAGSISKALRRLGVADYTRRTTRVMARLPDADEARLLQQPKNRPVLVTESVNVDANGKPIEYGVARFAADRVQIVFQS